jgi:dihydroorotate dehydrogenase
MIYRFIRPILFCFPPEWVHCWAILFVRFFYKKPNKLFNNLSNNPIGLAAGLDKNARAIDRWFNLGFGFIELGAVTPKPQPGNPKPRVFRLAQYHALINRFGFNNRGVNNLVKRLRKRKYQHGKVGVNLGKNATTPLKWALDDYRYGLTKVYPYADFVTVNISSPNTANLRDLQEASALSYLLRGLIKQKFLLEQYWQRKVPLYIKISPDLSDRDLENICSLVLELGIEGVIATNTTLSRHGLQGADEQGGLSGPPLFERALSLVARVRELTGSGITIIGVGGVSSAEDVKKMLAAGADLVQLYTALIYHGPGLIKQILRELNHAGFIQ